MMLLAMFLLIFAIPVCFWGEMKLCNETKLLNLDEAIVLDWSLKIVTLRKADNVLFLFAFFCLHFDIC